MVCGVDGRDVVEERHKVEKLLSYSFYLNEIFTMLMQWYHLNQFVVHNLLL